MKTYKNSDLRAIFAEYNKKCFGGRIPKCRCIFEDMNDRLGNFRCSANAWTPVIRITTSPKQVGLDYWPEWFLRETVLHEMIHAYIDYVLDGPKKNLHGKEFHDIVKKIWKEHKVRTYVNPLSALHRNSINPFVKIGDFVNGLIFRYFL